MPLDGSQRVRCLLAAVVIAAIGWASPQESSPAESRPASRPGLTVTILAVDSEGTPQDGIPIRVLGRAGTTDKAGIVRLELSGPDRPPWLGNKAAIRFDFPTLADAARLDLGRLEDRQIKVVVPVTGRVLARLVDAEGRPYTREARVRLLIRKPDSEDESRSVTADAHEGVASFPIVATGLSLEARLQMPPGIRTARVSFTGPVARGEQVVVDLICGLPAAVMKGRLLNNDGSPVAGAKLALEPEYWRSFAETRASATAMTQTDSDGSFRASLDEDAGVFSGMKIALRRWIAVPGGIRGLQPDRVIASVQLPRKPLSGEIDLGDVRIPEEPLLVAGTVVDGSGTPIKGALIRVEAFDRGRWSPLRSDASEWIEGRGGEDGRFEVRGAVRDTSVRAGATAQGWFLVEPIPFEIGTRDLRVVMARGGNLEGSLAPFKLNGDSVEAAAFRVLLCGEPVRSDLLYNERTDGIDLFRFGDRFMASELRPGLATVKLKFDGDSEPFLTVEGVEIRAGETNRDPRLQGIDLAKLVRQFRITVREESGGPVAQPEVYAQPAGSGVDSWAMFRGDGNGQVVVLSRTPTADLIVRAAGHRSSKVVRAESDLTITLIPARPIRVRVVLDPGVDLLQPPTQLGCALGYVRGLADPQPESMPFHHPIANVYRTTTFGSDRTATISVGDPGVYRVEVWAHTRSSAGGVGGRSLESYSDLVTVTDTSRDLEVHVRVSAEDVARYVENMRRR